MITVMTDERDGCKKVKYQIHHCRTRGCKLYFPIEKHRVSHRLSCRHSKVFRMLLRNYFKLLSPNLQPTTALITLKMLFSSCSSTSAGNQKDLMSKHLPKCKPILGVKKIIMIASGKGGVGKSTVAVNLAVALKTLQPQKDIGLLDADVFGPSVPLMMNVNDTPLVTDDDRLKPLMNYGVKFMSMGSLITETSAPIWRGLMVMNALNKLIRQVAWEPLDYMIIDTPPGTGDTHLSLHQNIPISGAIVVSTGQKAALQVTRRGITMFEKLQVPVIGLIHNMSYIQCTKCSNKMPMFSDHISEFSKTTNVEIIGEVPFDPSVSTGCDDGIPVVISHPLSLQARAFFNAASKITDSLPIN